jgi:hypothetical protein
MTQHKRLKNELNTSQSDFSLSRVKFITKNYADINTTTEVC